MMSKLCRYRRDVFQAASVSAHWRAWGGNRARSISELTTVRMEASCFCSRCLVRDLEDLNRASSEHGQKGHLCTSALE